MSGEPSRKRLREDDSSAVADNTPMWQLPTELDVFHAATRDKDFWFEDGNIVLVAGLVSYKVYKGLLAEHSTVFSSMFTVAQALPEDPSTNTVDGCPIVILYDSPNDLNALFSLIYPLTKNIRFSGSGLDSQINMEFISSIIRLDHKYELKGLYDEAIEYLTTYYTTNFEVWASKSNAEEWSPEPIHAITAINLARLTNTTSILPLAFYICATLGPEIARGHRLSDGSIERLSPDDLYLCLKLKEQLLAENAQSVQKVLRPAEHSLVQMVGGFPVAKPFCCQEPLRRVLDMTLRGDGPRSLTDDRALQGWMDNVDRVAQQPANVMAPAPPPQFHFGMFQQQAPAPPQHFLQAAPHSVNMIRGGLCNQCRAAVQKRDKDFRRQVWRKLPQILELQINGWDDPLA